MISTAQMVRIFSGTGAQEVAAMEGKMNAWIAERKPEIVSAQTCLCPQPIGRHGEGGYTMTITVWYRWDEGSDDWRAPS